MDLFKKGLTYREDNGNLWWMRGEVESSMGRVKDAISSFEHALKFFPGNVNLLLILGKTYGRDKQYDKALSYYDKAIGVHPNYGEAWRLRGLLCIDKGDIEAAKGNIRKAIAFLPSEDAEKKQALNEVLQKLEMPAGLPLEP